MSTDEQIIAAAKQKAAKLDVDFISRPIGPDGDIYIVQFKNGLRVRMSVGDAEAVVQEPKQEHDHANCNFCNSKIAAAFEFGVKTTQSKQRWKNELCMICSERSKLQRFDVDALASYIAGLLIIDNDAAQKYAGKIADNFAAPERKRITEADGYRIIKRSEYLYKHNDRQLNLAQATAEIINEVLALQPAPEAADRCPDCEHKDRSTDSNKHCVHARCICLNQFHRERGTV